MRAFPISCLILFYLWRFELVKGSNRTSRQAGCAGMYQCASGQCIQSYDVCNGLSQCEDETDELPSACDCGERTEVVRVTPAASNEQGVSYAKLGAYPWHAGIYRLRLDHPDVLLCSGVLIYSDIILTAASCVKDPLTHIVISTNDLAIGLGKLSKDVNSGEQTQQVVGVSDIVISGKYEGFYKFFASNLAILKLKTSTTRSHYVRTVCLWTEKNLPPDITSGSIVGWGLQFSGPYAINLREAMVDVITVQNCIRSHQNSIYRKYMTADKFCMIFKQGVGVRAEDAGGPITIYRDGRHYLYGLISRQFGTEFGLGTLTYKHRVWIKNMTYTLRQNDLCLQSKHFTCVSDGKCINLKQFCDGVKDCSDGSDEQNCRSVSNFGNANSCKIPNRGEILNVISCGVENGCNSWSSAPSFSQYQITCPEGFGFAANIQAVDTVCSNGKWVPPMENNVCLPLCKLEGHKSLSLTCKYMGEDISCHELLKPNTQISVECKRHYKKKELVKYADSTFCRRDGTINNELTPCEPVCGQPYNISGIQTLISGGEELKYAKYPWHIALYWKVQKDNYEHYAYKCGGSLIDTNKVLTAAHCVFNTTKVSETMLAIASGKRFRNWPQHEGEQWSQKAQVSKVIIGQYYDGAKTKHSEDIAVLILDRDLLLSDSTMPVCLDIDNESGGIPQGQLGHVLGWGSTSGLEDSPSNVLRETWMEYMDLHTCRKKFAKYNFNEYLQPDKFCGLYRDGQGTQVGDSGGGMTFLHNDLHYIYGIVSLKKTSQNEFALFTNVLSHRNFIKNILN